MVVIVIMKIMIMIIKIITVRSFATEDDNRLLQGGRLTFNCRNVAAIFCHFASNINRNLRILIFW